MITFVGILVALVALAGLALGLFMAADRRTREPGLLFALWWTPALAAAAGIFMRDPVTFSMGLVCFVVAGAALVFERASTRKSSKQRRFSPDSERTTQRAIRTQNRADNKTAS
ncbi:hypothetical protein GBA65_09060 [Rubrobacter marinus]|uniref:Uncharacterized protein n=1 Tax=Rubrobacter marinus TaxID=2653852 RepID=A0A6G8PWX5_9ACTN|nr:hypothetical protein [Rubrobacter marinus]QIN78647.1 hypothetical protein GBA65_09060 [Rubrobacter marinus]